MVKWKLKVLEENDGIVLKLRVERIYNEKDKDVWLVECGDEGDIDWGITFNDTNGNTFRLRATQKFSYRFVQSLPGFEPEDPWFMRKSDLIASIKKYGVKQTCLDIINYFVDWQSYLLPQDLLDP